MINTGTTIITFLMVFLIQNTQNRYSIAVHLKLDKLICAINEANNEVLAIEELDETELEGRREKMTGLAEEAKDAVDEVEDMAKEEVPDRSRKR